MCGADKRESLFLFARRDLVDRTLGRADRALLLEGSWPAGTSAAVRWSLDAAIDARFDWIDEEVSRLTACVGPAGAAKGPSTTCAPIARESDGPTRISLAWLNALALRYYLVKLIRPIVYFSEVRPLRAGQRVRLVASPGRDEDYADLLAEICRLAGASCRLTWVKRPRPPASTAVRNAWWRRGAAFAGGLIKPRHSAHAARSRVVLCGNPRLLDPICRELVRAECRVWWLYQRFAIRSWLRWRTAGVDQLTCGAKGERPNRLAEHLPERLEWRGVNLAGPIRRWLAERSRTHGPRQTALLERIDAHFRDLQPHSVVLDEDATPMARAVLGVGRHHGATSFVVQHGAPCCRFGFAPIAADRILVWGQSSESQLIRWGVPPERIQVLGSPRHDLLHRTLGRCPPPRRVPWATRLPLCWQGQGRASRPRHPRPPRILLLTTVPPRDDRPDAVALHLTRGTYAQMLRMGAAAVAKIPGASLVVKLHPRAADDQIAKAVLASFPSLTARIVARGPLNKWLGQADCVLSCLSSAGVDATLAGVPVIQLLPAGSGDVLPHQHWGLLGTARTEAELQPLLVQALAADQQTDGAPDSKVFASLDGQSAKRIAEAVLRAVGQAESVHGFGRSNSSSFKSAECSTRVDGIERSEPSGIRRTAGSLRSTAPHP